MAAETVDVVIIGGGHAGLATAAQLKRAGGVSSVVLEGSPRVGNSWHKRYNRLHLHTPKVVSSLPFFKLPPSYPMYPSKQQVIDYLSQYVTQLDLSVRLRHHVTGVTYDAASRLYTTRAVVWEGGADDEAGGYAGAPTSTTTRNVTFVSKALVLATGPESVPVEATLPGQGQFQGQVVHSTRYKDGKDFKGKRVLVVGSGNSGGEISLCLSEHGAQPTMLIRSMVPVVRVDDGMLTGILAKFNLKETIRPYIKWVDKLAALVAFLLAPNLRPYGVPQCVPGVGTKGLMENLHSLNAPFVDVGQGAAIQRGDIKVQLGELRGFTPKGVLIAPPIDKAKLGAGGWGQPQEHQFDAVVLCTGYDRVGSFRNVLSAELLAKALPPGASLPPSGVAVPGQPGLFFVGWDDMFSRICMGAQESAAVAKGVRTVLAT